MRDTNGGSDAARFDSLWRVMANEERRRLLGHLAECDTPVGLDSLAASVATDDTHERVRIRLHHVHLPMMETVRLVDYDARERVVDQTDSGEEAAAVRTAVADALD